MREEAILAREVEVTAIPYGDRITLPAASPVIITQSLGGAYTLVTMQGYMVRLDSKDADAIGKEVEAGPTAEEAAKKPLQELAWDQLKTCYDPEIPVDIVELGLVYSCEVAPLPEGGSKVAVRFTLTAPGCGMGDVLKTDLQRKIQRLPNIAEVDIEVVFQPQWNPNMMSEAARLQLGMM